MEEPEGLAAAADELYGADPDGFVERREALAKAARLAKDRPLAAAIKALRRPTLGAWYVNLAARAPLASLVEALKLGRELRDAQARLDFRRVVELGPRRAELERRVLRDLTAHLAALGVTATPAALEEVRSTLRAALADADAAAAVQSGRLARPLAYGEPGDGLTAALAAAAGAAEAAVAGDGAAPAGPTGDDDELAALDREAAAAEAALRESQAALEAVRARRERLAAERGREAARRRLAEAERTLLRTRDARDALAARLADAEAALGAAERAAAAARAELDRYV